MMAWGEQMWATGPGSREITSQLRTGSREQEQEVAIDSQTLPPVKYFPQQGCTS